MKYVYIVCAVVCFLLGGFVGHKFFPRTELREVPVTVTKEVVKLKQVVKYADGKVVETEKFVETDKAQVSPQPKPQYRVGALLPLRNELQLDKATVSVSRRAFGQLWLDLQFNPSTREALVGASVEF